MPEGYVLPKTYENVHLQALRFSSRRQLALYLNLEGTIVDSVGILNDFHGLAELIGFEYLEIRNFANQKSPTEELLEKWTETEHLRPTVGALWQHLVTLERVDILTDVWTFLSKNLLYYNKLMQKLQVNEIRYSLYNVHVA